MLITLSYVNRIPFPRQVFLFLQVVFLCMLASNGVLGQINYKKVSGSPIGTNVKLSPDPLVKMKWESIKASDDLEYYYLRPESYKASLGSGFDMRHFKRDNIIAVNGAGDIRFDFGRVSAGWLEFDSDDLIDSVSMSISEYNEPSVVNKGPLHHFKTAPVVKDGRTYRIVLNSLWYEGVRYGWIHVTNHTRKWHIKNLRLVCQIKPTNYVGSFSCSDDELTKIWYTGAYTVKLNLLKDYFGAILMDRGDRHSWTGDAFPSQAASMVAFGNYDFVKKNIENTANLNNDIASYALYWVLSLIDYVNYTGDIELLRKYKNNIEKKLTEAYLQFGKHPKLLFYGWDERLGAGFENPQTSEAQHAYAMLSIRAWTSFGNLMIKTGNLEMGQHYQGWATEKMNKERKEGEWLNKLGLHSAADAINTTLMNKQEEDLLFKTFFTDRVNRLSYSPFNQWFIISAMAKADRYDEAMSAIKDCWGGQLKYGATTFFEVFRPEWNDILQPNEAPPNNQCGYTSFAHPWSAGVVKWLSEETLGIKPLEPGFKTFQIIPHLGSNLTVVEGSTPTMNGLITARFDSKSGKADVSVPTGTLAKTVWLPVGKSDPKSLRVNGKKIWNSSSKDTHKIQFHPTNNENYLIIHDLKAGDYSFKITLRKKNKKTPYIEQSRNYSIKSIRQDSLTRGHWKETFGRDGYVIFNQLGTSTNQELMPDYLDKVTTRLQSNVHNELQQADTRVLEATEKATWFGAITTKDYSACLQTMTMDVPVKDEKTHQISIYFLDLDQKGRRSAIEVFDMKTGKLLAPMAYLKNYETGRYLFFNFQGPIRIRINQVRGINASVSGIFFDPPKETQ